MSSEATGWVALTTEGRRLGPVAQRLSEPFEDIMKNQLKPSVSGYESFWFINSIRELVRKVAREGSP